ELGAGQHAERLVVDRLAAPDGAGGGAALRRALRIGIRIRVRIGIRVAVGRAVQRRGALAVALRHAEVVRRAAALRVVHGRGGVVGGERAPVVVLEALAGLGPGVLVAEAE